MKIGYVLDDSLDKSDGVQQYILTVGHWMQQQGHEVHYIVGQTKRTDIAHVHSFSRNLQVHFNQNRMSTPLPANKNRITKFLAKEKFDVLHVQMPYSPFLAGRVILAADKSTAIVGSFHIIPFSKVERIATKILRLLLWRSIRRFDAVVSVSRPAQIFARNDFRISSNVIPNAVQYSHFQSGKRLKKYDDGKINIVFLGRLVERKGCLYLLKAIQRLHEQHQLLNVRVIICGKGPLEEALKSYCTSHHLNKIVNFIGYVKESDKPSYLASADIAVFPSTGGESFGIVLIEAMAANSGVVLAGDNIGYKSVISEQPKQLVSPKDTDEFAKKLKHYIYNQNSRIRASRWQNQYVRQFDINAVGAKLINIYHAAVAKKS